LIYHHDLILSRSTSSPIDNLATFDVFSADVSLIACRSPNPPLSLAQSFPRFYGHQYSATKYRVSAG